MAPPPYHFNTKQLLSQRHVFFKDWDSRERQVLQKTLLSFRSLFLFFSSRLLYNDNNVIGRWDPQNTRRIAFMAVEMWNDMGTMTCPTKCDCNDSRRCCFGMLRFSRHGVPKSDQRQGLPNFSGARIRAKGMNANSEDGIKKKLDLYIIVSYGTKFRNMAHNVQAKSEIRFEPTLGLACPSRQFYVQGVRLTKRTSEKEVTS